ncbi:response regulator transcription factor [Aquibacillus kalidii]|uniref:response regulator transcription factor n=1 Tax=Aquibacillus kalidii TaxID=2762597 RepID=UPI001646B473|nr:response regulator transcription factor [Aquibacillus kalidii]
MSKHTVIVAESQTLFREMISTFIKELDEFKVIAQLVDGQEVIDFIRNKEIRPTLCLLDVSLPVLSGINCAKWLKSNFPDMKIVFITVNEEERYIENVMSIGVDGYILKNTDLAQFKQILRLIMDGYFITSQSVIQQYSSRLSHLIKVEVQGSPKFIKESLEFEPDLSDKEIQLIQRVNKGWSNRMIANDLMISEGTVKNYLSSMYRKLKIKSRTELIQLLSKSS